MSIAAEPTKETPTDEAQTFGDYKAIVEALKPYIEGAIAGDGNKAITPLFDHTRIVGSMDGQFYNMDAASFSDVIDELGEAPDVEYHIAWIDISGPAAAAKIESNNWLGFRFTDFFVLYKHEGEWKISGKVYDTHSRNYSLRTPRL